MKPENSSLFILIAALIFGGTIYTQVSGEQLAQPAVRTWETGPETPSKSEQAGGSESGKLCSRGVDDLIKDFFQINAEEPPAKDPETFVKQRGYALEFLVATVPDPVDSQVGWLFDVYLDAIQHAIVTNDYVLDRYTLPWECTREAEKDRADGSLVRPHEDRPGVVMFRHLSEQRLLVLFLVGETPTWGIHKKAFAHALDKITEFQGL